MAVAGEFQLQPLADTFELEPTNGPAECGVVEFAGFQELFRSPCHFRTKNAIVFEWVCFVVDEARPVLSR